MSKFQFLGKWSACAYKLLHFPSEVPASIIANKRFQTLYFSATFKERAEYIDAFVKELHSY